MKNKTRFLLINLLLISAIFISCNSSSKDSELIKITKERDSLQGLLSEIDQKYVFDSIRLVTEPNPDNLLIPGSEYNLKFYFIGYNKDTYFVEDDSLNKVSKDSLFPDRGIFHYNTLLMPDQNEFEGLISTNSKFGKNYKAVLHNPDLLEK
ncbi:hypothetical protein [Yeosuana marina]|uniref:hypothetical protein n=1 Tax=Yeosuana marina TaxID=1565536 RepID=UPI0030EE7DEC|tara:strand:+ start:36 stop:488 length:453 start_codon:yes stop_codon:yes gene_type:complete